MREIAEAIGVVKSAIWYELRKRTRKGRRYNAAYAQHRAYTKRKYARAQGRTIALHASLRKIVEDYLMDDQSPENIAGRIKKHLRHLPHISATLIRRFIASPYGRRIESHRKKIFTKYRKRWKKRVSIDGRRMISKRPKYIALRKRVGDAEGDFLASGRGGAGLILNITDRKSRAPFFEKIYPVSIRAVERAIGRIIKRFPELRTLTLDNDILFLHHRRLELKFNIKIFFCFPGRPYEKGTNENRNKIVRRYIRKGSDISKIPRSRIHTLETKLQRRIMRCLNYQTPLEVLEHHRTKNKRR